MEIRKGKPTGDGSRLERGRASWDVLRVRLPLLPPCGSRSRETSVIERQKTEITRFRLHRKCVFDRAAEVPALQAGQVGSTPTRHSRGSSKGRISVFEADDGGSNPSPRMVYDKQNNFGAVAAGRDPWL